MEVTCTATDRQASRWHLIHAYLLPMPGPGVT